MLIIGGAIYALGALLWFFHGRGLPASAVLLLAVLPPLFLGGWSEWLRRSFVFLVISCPCALVISVPLTFPGGVGAASRRGVLIKGSNYLEALCSLETVVFDKTGTLTEGSFQVRGVYPAQGVEESELLRCAAAAERYSTHPIARSILSYWGEDAPDVEGQTELSGRGVRAELGIDEYAAALLPEQKLEYMETLMERGGNLAYVGDGINDAPVLSRADVGIAMGALGSDAAIEAADVVLMTDEPGKLPEALDVARKTHRIVMENIVFALGIKFIFLVMGAVGLAGMWIAVIGDVGVMVAAVLNAMRMMRH